MRTRLAALLLLLALRADAGKLYNRSYTSPADGAARAYDVWVPSSYDGVHPIPAILFLHGRGLSKSSFETPAYESAADANGFALLFWEGRFRADIGVFSTYYVDGKNGVPDETDVLACLDDALGAWAIDPARVHLAGFSQGGKGALLIGLKNPGRFATIVEGAGPSDAFQGQDWVASFPDFAAAAGGSFVGASGETLAMWYAQSARFLLANARNLPIALSHGTQDTVIPDSLSFYPYRNTHHVADTPGFSDARGVMPTLSELRAADPSGYEFQTAYPPVGHDQDEVLAAPWVFAFVSGRNRPARPARVVARAYDARTRPFYWLRVGRTTPPDGSVASAVADLEAGSVSFATSGAPALTLDVAAAGLDIAAGFSLRFDAGSDGALRMQGAFPAQVRLLRDGARLTPGADYQRDGSDVLLPIRGGATGSTVTLAPEPAPIVSEDLLVPALVDAPGMLGAHFRSELVLANFGDAPARFEALLVGVGEATVTLDVPARSTAVLGSADLLARFGLTQAASPLRLRVVAGDAAKLFATQRVFNDAPWGTYGLSFPVFSAAASVLAAGEKADFFCGAPSHPARTNLSLFAPFGAAAAEVTVLDAAGSTAATFPVSLAPLERQQLDDIARVGNEPARVVVTVVSGSVQAYATVIDRAANNDPFRSPPLLRVRAATSWTVPAVAAAPGKNGAHFTSDLFVAAPAGSRADVPLTVTFLPRDGGAPLTATLSLPSGSSRAVEDLLGSLFPQTLPAAGALAVTSGEPVQLLAVTRSDSPAGPASQDLPAVAAGGEITPSTPAVFAGLSESAAARSNLVLVNRGDATVVTVAAIAVDGWRGARDVPLASGAVVQLDSVLASFGAPTAGAALLVAPRSGAVVATAMRIDNRSNDAAGLAPVPAPALAR